MKTKNLSGSGFEVGKIGKSGNFSGAQIDKRERIVVEIFKFSGCIILDLIFVGGQSVAVFFAFCFDNPNRFSVNKQNIISLFAILRKIIPDNNP